MKRLLDVAMALILAVPAVVICMVVSLIIVATERKSAFFVQTRVGKNEKQFSILKLRTMRKSAQNVGTHEISSDAITTTGRWVRRTKIDELPQLWNVLMGQMSFVGPRPCLPTQAALIKARRQHGVFDVLPGITGLAQINNIDMSTPVKLAECDANYIRTCNTARDLRILALTLMGKGLSDKVKTDACSQTGRE